MIALAIIAALGLIGFGFLIHGMCVVSKHSDTPPKAVKMERIDIGV